MSRRTGCGDGKLLLFGEHAAVYGHPAVGLALPIRVCVHLEEDESSHYRFPTLPQVHVELAMKLAQTLSSRGLLAKGGSVRITGTVPIGAGLGSSAAFCVALARCAIGDRDQLRTWEIANELERVFHGTPSGIDTGLATFGGVHAFYRDHPSDALPTHRAIEPNRFVLLVGTVPRDRTTRTLVARIRERVAAAEPTVLSAMDTLGRYATEAIALLRDGGVDLCERLGECADGAHETLTELGLGHRDIDRALDICRSHGALGGKLSGAGGGGAYYAVFSSSSDAVHAQRLLGECNHPSKDTLFVVTWTGASAELVRDL